MSGAKEIRSKIASIKNTQKITKAMQMVAAAKLRRAQEAAEAARPYAERMGAVLANLAYDGTPLRPLRSMLFDGVVPIEQRVHEQLPMIAFHVPMHHQRQASQRMGLRDEDMGLGEGPHRFE